MQHNIKPCIKYNRRGSHDAQWYMSHNDTKRNNVSQHVTSIHKHVTTMLQHVRHMLQNKRIVQACFTVSLTCQATQPMPRNAANCHYYVTTRHDNDTTAYNMSQWYTMFQTAHKVSQACQNMPQYSTRTAQHVTNLMPYVTTCIACHIKGWTIYNVLLSLHNILHSVTRCRHHRTT